MSGSFLKHVQVNPKSFNTVEEKITFRMSLFNTFATHPWYKKVWAKLKPVDIEFCKQWVAENHHLKGGEIDHYSNRIDWKGMGDKHGKRITTMWELISTIGLFVKRYEEGWTIESGDYRPDSQSAPSSKSSHQLS